MSTTKRWGNFSLKLHTLTAQSGGAVYIDGIRSQRLSPGLRTGLERGDSSVSPSFGSLVSGAPVGSGETSDLKAFLDECGVTGMLVDADVTHPGVVMSFRKYDQGGTRVAVGTAEHFTTTVENGILIPKTLSASHQGPATLSYELVAFESGGTAPITWDEAATLDSVNPTVDLIHTVGKVDLSGTQLSGVRSISVDFGLSVTAEGGDSDVYPTITYIVVASPKIQIVADHIDFTSTLTEDGLYDATGSVIYFRKRDEGGTFVADGTAEHIKLTLGKCRWNPGELSGDPKTLNITVEPWDTPGGTAQLAINTASAIT